MGVIRMLQQLLRETRGATAVEYGLIVALVVIAIIGAVSSVADENNGLWAKVRDNVETVM